MHSAARLRERRAAGTIVVLSSVAAERPRRANAVYGAAKAGLDALARGSATSCRSEGVRVLVVRPGFVQRPMTRALRPRRWRRTPEEVATSPCRRPRRRRAGRVGAPHHFAGRCS